MSSDTLYYFTAEEWSLLSDESLWGNDSAVVPVTTTETFIERDALILSKDIFGALVKHELRQHSDEEDTTKPMDCIFTQCILDEMEERYDKEAEANLMALINEFYKSENKYNTSLGPETKTEVEEDREEDPSLDRSIIESNLPKYYSYKPIDRFFKVKQRKKEHTVIDYEISKERSKPRQKKERMKITKRGGTRKPPPDHRIDNTSLLGKRHESKKRKKRTVWSKNKTHLGYRQQLMMLICNRAHMVKRIGEALKMLVLLRRCLYPKRDVIRWK